MRTEKEMFDLIAKIAKDDERIRAVYINGSRCNLNATKDIFQDYDIVYVVKKTSFFYNDINWIDVFGERLYMQYPDEFDISPEAIAKKDNCYGYLIQCSDGNRVDLHIKTLECAKQEILKDKLCMIVLDKDDCLPTIPVSTDEDYFVSKPTQHVFSCVSNEFWWCLNNVAKGLWREEIPYVQDIINLHIRQQLVVMLSWQIGIDTNFCCSIGKSGKYMHRYLTDKTFKSFLKTYSSADIDNIWQSVFIMCDLFDTTAKYVSSKLKLSYDIVEANNSLEFLKNAQHLPRDAKAIY